MSEGPGEGPSGVEASMLDELERLIGTTASTRFWQLREVSRETCDALVRMALLAPSSCNRQGLKVLVERRAPVSRGRREANNRAMLENAPLIFYFACERTVYPELFAPALDAGMAAQNLLVYANALGLKGCPMYHSESFNQTSLRAKLQLPGSYYIYLAVLVGYPAEVAVKPPRLRAPLRVDYL
jgi:nitroreductase